MDIKVFILQVTLPLKPECVEQCLELRQPVPNAARHEPGGAPAKKR